MSYSWPFVLDDIPIHVKGEARGVWRGEFGKRGKEEKRTLDDVHGGLLVAVFILEFVHGAVAFDVEEGSSGRVLVSLVCGFLVAAFSFALSLSATFFFFFLAGTPWAHAPPLTNA